MCGKIWVFLFYSSYAFSGLSWAEHGINNFHFITTNTIYGNKLPQKVNIKGTYYIDFEKFKFKNKEFLMQRFVENIIKKKGPWYCTVNTANLLANISNSNFEQLSSNMKELEKQMDSHSFEFWSEKLKPFVPIDACKLLPVRSFQKRDIMNDDYKGYVHQFELTINFDSFSPVLFVDYFGMAAFNYKQKLKIQDPMKDRGQPLRYCDGSLYGDMIYTPEPRPICPTELSDHRIHERGVITVYKPNIVPISRRLHRCRQGHTNIYSGKQFCCFAERYDNSPLETITEPTSYGECETMIKNKTSPSGNLTLVNQGLQDLNDYATNNDKSFDYGGALDFSSHSRTVYDHFLNIGLMKVFPPRMTIETPMGSIPRNYLYKKSYSIKDARFNWDPFKKEDLCLYVPQKTIEVEAIHYPHAAGLVETSASSGMNTTTFFLSEKLKGVWSVDDTLILSDISKFNCIQKNLQTDVIYMMRNGDIIKWQKNKKMVTAAKSPDVAHLFGTTHQDHGYSSFVEISKVENNVLKVQNKHSQGHDPADDSIIDVSKIKPTKFGQMAPVATNHNDTVGWKEAFQYIEYVEKEIQNANVHARAISECHQSQLEWDMFVQLLDISPSIAIGGRIRQAVKAIHAGNGFYAVKKCQLIESAAILTSLFTNDTVKYKMNGKLIQFRELVATLGTTPSNGKCLSYPLIKFSLEQSNHEFIGQLTRDGTINTNEIKLLEDCHNNRHLVFNINNMTYFFKEYKLVGKANTHEVMLKLKNIQQGAELLKSGSQAVLNPIDEFINNIHLIHINDPLRETKFKHFDSSHTIVDRYNIFERQASLMSLIEMQQEVTRTKYADRIWRQNVVKDFTGSKTKSSTGVDNFGSTVLDVFATGAKGIVNMADNIAGGIGHIGTKIGDAIGNIGSGAGSAVGDIGKGVGSAVGDIGKGVGDGVGALGKGFAGIFTSIVIPVVVVVVLAVAGYFVYTKFITGDPKREKMPPSYEEVMEFNNNEEDELSENDDIIFSQRIIDEKNKHLKRRR